MSRINFNKSTILWNNTRAKSVLLILFYHSPEGKRSHSA